MDDETILAMGEFCDSLISNPNFQFMCAWFEQQALGDMLATKPEEAEARERIYTRISAHREFISQMAEIVRKRNAAIEPQDLSDIDDPAVHNIYKDFD